MQLLPLLMHSSLGQRVSSESSLLGLTQKKRLTPEKQRMQRRPLVTRGRPSLLNATLMDCEWHG